MDNELPLLIDLHRHNPRQGPGGDAETLLALQLAGVDRTAALNVADIGCGTGAASVLLAAHTQASIVAVDCLPEFLDELGQRARAAGLDRRISAQCASMDSLPYADGAFDLLWSEGAIYNMGFARGIQAWRRLLKPGGVLVVSEITWTTTRRPAEIAEHWQREYPEIDLASAKLAQLERAGYAPIGYFTLPEHCWLDNYYRPLQAGFEAFLARHRHAPAAQAAVAAEQKEIALYQAYQAYFSYAVYVARRQDDGCE